MSHTTTHKQGSVASAMTSSTSTFLFVPLSRSAVNLRSSFSLTGTLALVRHIHSHGLGNECFVNGNTKHAVTDSELAFSAGFSDFSKLHYSVTSAVFSSTGACSAATGSAVSAETAVSSATSVDS